MLFVRKHLLLILTFKPFFPWLAFPSIFHATSTNIGSMWIIVDYSGL